MYNKKELLWLRGGSLPQMWSPMMLEPPTTPTVQGFALANPVIVLFMNIVSVTRLEETIFCSRITSC
jgi:hypothetical protein